MSTDKKVIAAAKSGDLEALKKALKEGGDIHERGEQDWTPLNFAAGRGDLAMVKFLVESGADITLTGRDKRTPFQIARAAERKDVYKYLRAEEDKRGIKFDSHRPFCKAYYLRDLRKFKGWTEAKIDWKINKYWPDDIKAEYEKDFGPDDVVFVHDNFVVTKSMWRNENIIYNNVTPEWETFCKKDLAFAIPEDLQ